MREPCELARVHLAVVTVIGRQAAAEDRGERGRDVPGQHLRVRLKSGFVITVQRVREVRGKLVLPGDAGAQDGALQLGVVRAQLGERGLDFLGVLCVAEPGLGLAEPCAVRGGLGADLGQLLAGPLREIVLRGAGLGLCGLRVLVRLLTFSGLLLVGRGGGLLGQGSRLLGRGRRLPRLQGCGSLLAADEAAPDGHRGLTAVALRDLWPQGLVLP